MADEISRLVIQVDSSSAKDAKVNTDGVASSVAAATSATTAFGNASAAAGGKSKALSAILTAIAQSSKQSAASLAAIQQQQVATSASTEKATMEFRVLVASISELIGVSKGSSDAFALLAEREVTTVRTSLAAATSLDTLTAAARNASLAATDAAKGTTALTTADTAATVATQRATAATLARADAIRRVFAATKLAAPTLVVAPPLAGVATLRDIIAANSKATLSNTTLQAGLANVSTTAAVERLSLVALTQQELALGAATDAATGSQIRQASALRQALSAAPSNIDTQRFNNRLRTLSPPPSIDADVAALRAAALARIAPPQVVGSIGPKASELDQQFVALMNARRGFAALADAEARIGKSGSIESAAAQVTALAAASTSAAAREVTFGSAMSSAAKGSDTLIASLREQVEAARAAIRAEEAFSAEHNIAIARFANAQARLRNALAGQMQSPATAPAGATTAVVDAAHAAEKLIAADTKLRATVAAASAQVARPVTLPPTITDHDIGLAASAKSLVGLKELQRQNDATSESQSRLLRSTAAGSAEFHALQEAHNATAATGFKLENAISSVNASLTASKVNASGAKGLFAQLKESFTSTDGAISTLVKSVGALGLAYAAVNVARHVLDMADAYQQVTNKVTLFATSAANVVQLQASLVKIAVETRTPLETIAQMFTKISASSKELGASQSDILKITKTIGQTFILSGTTTQQAAMSANEFARAISEGNLSGRELKVLLGDNVALAQAIAAGFGVSVGRLREMAAEGDLLAKDVFAALLIQTDAIATRAQSIAPTMSGGFAVFKTGLEAAIGRLDTALGITRDIGLAFENIGKILAGFQGIPVPDWVRILATGVNQNVADANRMLDFVLFGKGTARDAFGSFRPAIGDEVSRSPEATARRDAAQSSLTQRIGSGDFAAGSLTGGSAAIGQLFQNAIASLTPKPAPTTVEFGSREATAKDGDLAKLFKERNGKADKARDAAEQKMSAAAKALTEYIVRAYTAFGRSLDVDQQVQLAQNEVELADVTKEFGAHSEQVAALLKVQGAETAALQAKIDEQARRTKAQIRIADNTLTGLVKPVTVDTSFTDALNAQRTTAGKKLAADEQAAAKQAEQIAQAFITNVQNVFAKGIDAVFTKGINGIADFGKAIRDTILQAFEQVLASAITKQFLKLFTVGEGGAASAASGGGLFGSLASLFGLKNVKGLFGGAKNVGGAGVTPDGQVFGAGAGGASAGGVGVSAAGLAGIGAGVFGFGVGAIVGNNTNSTVGAASGALAGAATGAVIGSIVPGLGTLIGGIVGGAAGLLGGLFGGSQSAARKKAAQQLAQQAVAFSDQLTIRGLVAAGDGFAAGKKRLELEQKAELEALTKQFGAASEVVRKARDVQASELAKYEADNSESTLAAGTYLAPPGFDAAPYRFEAGRPTFTPTPDSGMTLSGNNITITVPEGTPRSQAEEIVRQLQGIAQSQGYSPNQWSQAVIQ